MKQPGIKKTKALVWMAAIVVGAAFFTPSCTHYYVKPGQTNADFERDKRDCEKIAAKEAARKNTRVCDEVERCLIATKGWTRD